MTRKIFPYFENRVLPDTKLRLNTGIILYQKDTLFLELRSDNHMFGFLGGSVNPGESPLSTIQREVKEESGLDLYQDQICFLGIYGDISDYRVAHYPEGSFHFIDIIYYYKLESNPLFSLSTESLAIEQFDFANIPYVD